MKNLKYVYFGAFAALGLLYLNLMPSTGQATGMFNIVQYNIGWLAGLIFILGLLFIGIYFKE